MSRLKLSEPWIKTLYFIILEIILLALYEALAADSQTTLSSTGIYPGWRKQQNSHLDSSLKQDTVSHRCRSLWNQMKTIHLILSSSPSCHWQDVYLFILASKMLSGLLLVTRSTSCCYSVINQTENIHRLCKFKDRSREKKRI